MLLVGNFTPSRSTTMFRLHWFGMLAIVSIFIFIRQALAADLLGHENLKGIPAAKVKVDLDVDAVSEGSFLRSSTQLNERIAGILRNQGFPLSDTGAPVVNCFLKIRALPVGQFNTPVFMYRLETSVVEEVTLDRPLPTPTSPPVKRMAQIWRKADFGFAVPAMLSNVIDVQLDKQAETLAKD